MGYWEQNETGYSFADATTGEEMLWGDRPADIVDDALAAIKEAFVRDVGRPPTKSEIVAGLVFSLGGDDDVPDGVAWPYRNRTVPPAHVRSMPTAENIDAACRAADVAATAHMGDRGTWDEHDEADKEILRVALRAVFAWIGEGAQTPDPTARLVMVPTVDQTGPRDDG